MYELIILAQLMRGPAHGYLIAKIINDMFGPFARISNGRLYPLLAKLEHSGLIAVATQNSGQQGDRQLRAYRLTEAGCRRFHEIMMNTTSNPGEYQKFFQQKVSYFEFLKPVERLRLIDHYLNYCQAHVLHMQAEVEDMLREAPSWDPPVSGRHLEDMVNVIQHSIDQWQLELAWTQRLREHEVVQIEVAKEAETL
ncbi:MAG: PadR family transcriptional regulator [Ktedonobacteraceae bacterium]|nr:PadR family transcriptional regulator [Ktedonobacteraceae bacterium]